MHMKDTSVICGYKNAEIDVHIPFYTCVDISGHLKHKEIHIGQILRYLSESKEVLTKPS